MAMKKNISKALAMAIMMSVLAGGQVYAKAGDLTLHGKNLINEFSSDNNYSCILLEDAECEARLWATALVFQDLSSNISAQFTPVWTFMTGSDGKKTIELENNGNITATGTIKAGISGEIKSGETGLVNGGAVYTALQGKVDAGTATGLDALAVGKNATAEKVNSLAIGNGALAAEDSAIAIGNSAYSGGSHSVAIGNSAYAAEIGAYAIGQNSHALGQNSYAIGNNASAKADNSIALGNYSVADEKNTISVGTVDGGRRIVNVAKGEKDTDAVNFSQIKAVDGNYVKEANTVAKNFTALDTQVKLNADAIAKKADLTYVDTELSKKANASDVAALGTRVGTAENDISNLKTDVGALDTRVTAVEAFAGDISTLQSDVVKKADKTALDAEAKAREQGDADTLKKANEYTDQEIAKISGGASSEALEKLDSKINQTNDRVNRVGATAAALAAINYQPMAKGQSQVAVGMGGYKGKKATALGLAYQISDRISGSVAGAANGSEHMFNVGFNYLFGQHSDKDVAQIAAVPGSVSLKEAELQSEVEALKADNQAMQARMAQLEAMVKALAVK